MIFRVLLLIIGAAALVVSITTERPERFAGVSLCALAGVIVAAGAAAAHAVPLRRVQLACSVATLLLAPALLNRGDVHVPISAAIVLVQIVGLASVLIGSQRSPHEGGENRVYTRLSRH